MLFRSPGDREAVDVGEVGGGSHLDRRRAGARRGRHAEALVGEAHRFESPQQGRLADEVAVMRAGEVVERGDVQTLFRAPATAYARDLIEASPRVDR